jgi:hypothetical protein
LPALKPLNSNKPPFHLLQVLQAVVVFNPTKTPSAFSLQPEYSQYFMAIKRALKLGVEIALPLFTTKIASEWLKFGK